MKSLLCCVECLFPCFPPIIHVDPTCHAVGNQFYLCYHHVRINDREPVWMTQRQVNELLTKWGYVAKKLSCTGYVR